MIGWLLFLTKERFIEDINLKFTSKLKDITACFAQDCRTTKRSKSLGHNFNSLKHCHKKIDKNRIKGGLIIIF